MATATIAEKASKKRFLPSKKKKIKSGAVGSVSGTITAIVFFLPFFVLFCIFTIGPAIYSAFYSVTNFDMVSNPDFVGLDNFRGLFLDDPLFFQALKVTFLFGLVAGPAGYIMSFIMAWVLNDMKGRKVLALAFYAPSLCSGAAMGSVWKYIFSSDRYGLINNVLINLGVISSPILWSENPDTILPCCILIQIWMSMGTGFLVFMAGLQNQDRELLEAASLDGIKNRFQELFYIILPQMKPQLLFGAINTIANSFGAGGIISEFAGNPTPNYVGHTMVQHISDYAFTRLEMGYASAVALVLFAITFAASKLCMWMLTDRD
ncbi:MAG: sugar ABC transporter permease [Oscillospiraceae bacterium]|nr:sugar ABC transporter permease [Oscillospiraceae bacterium]